MAQRVTETGRLDGVSLFARFRFSWDELWAAGERWRVLKQQGQSAAKPTELRTEVPPVSQTVSIRLSSF